MAKLIDDILAEIPATDPRKASVGSLAAFFLKCGLEAAPYSVGMTYRSNDRGNYPGGLVDHIAGVHRQIKVFSDVYTSAGVSISPASNAIVSMGHVASKVTDGFGNPYYLLKPALKNGDMPKIPWETNPNYAELPAAFINAVIVRAYIPDLTKEELQAISLAALPCEDLLNGLKMYPLTNMLRMAIMMGLQLEKHV